MFLLLYMALCGAPGLAGEEPLFAIHEIHLEGSSLSQDLILAEAGLSEGTSYSERELVMARRRLLRLPFILEADLQLTRGPEPGSFNLVIHLQTQKSLFFRYAYSARERGGTTAASGAGSPSDDSEDRSGVLSLGGRGFFGRAWSWYALTELDQNDSDLDWAKGNPIDVGLSHYNLFDRRIFFNLNLQFMDRVDGTLYDPFLDQDLPFDGERDLSPALTLALPLGRSQQWLSLRAGYLAENLRFESEDTTLSDTVTEHRLELRLAWFYDSTDDLALPREGLRLESGLDHVRVSSDFSVSLRNQASLDNNSVENLIDDGYQYNRDPNANEATGRNTVQGLEHYLEAAWFRPMSPSFSLFTKANYRHRLDERGDKIRDAGARSGALALGGDYDLAHLLPRRPFDDLRLLTSLSYSETRDDFFRERITALELGLAWRLRWGLARVSFRYEDLDVHERTTLRVEGDTKP